jgi:predicted ATPase
MTVSIVSLKLQNFKPFKEQLLPFKPLTLLSGLNSTGKSSILQSLLLLRQSYLQRLLPENGIILNGDLVNIGTVKDALFEGAKKEEFINFDITWSDDKQGIWNFQELENLNTSFINLFSEIKDSEVYKTSLFTKNFHYIPAERIGPRAFNKISYDQVKRLGTLGNRCEYTLHFLELNESKDISDSKLSHPNVKFSQFEYEDPETPSLKLIDQVEAWMGEISPGTRLKIKSSPDMDVIKLQCGYGDSNPYRATNVGFGIAYTLPIIVAVLASSPGTLILVENPEAHLHPRGQAKMGELLALAASCGIQVVIETHSDHVLNGIRLAVHRRKLKHEDVQLYYLERQKIGTDKFTTEVVSPRIDKYGRIDKWPDGFFDQMEKDLMELM